MSGSATGARSSPSHHDLQAQVPQEQSVLLRYIDWIWHIRGSVPLAPGQSSDDAFDRLDPLFDETGTSHQRSGDTLVFTKKDPAAQDKMAVFESGTLSIEDAETGPELRYHLISRALLYCFLAPLLFLGLAQLTIHFGKAPKPPEEAAATSGKAAKTPAKKEPELKLHPIDKVLGAPEPEKPKKDGKDKKKEDEKKPSGTPAYVFAGIFAALYIIGRILEAWLIKRLLRRRLAGV